MKTIGHFYANVNQVGVAFEHTTVLTQSRQASSSVLTSEDQM